MFTIEHDFDATVVTLVDEGAQPLGEDVTITVFEDGISIEQFDARTDKMQRVTLTASQASDLKAALDLPEGTYRRASENS